jgi:mannose-6-phosphate isomerase-like protein (cupin superfamily)
MKPAIGLFVFALCGSLTTTAQIPPSDSGGCGISSSGTVSCSFAGAAPISKADGSTGKQSVPADSRDFMVIRIRLSPGAPLTKWVSGEDEIIVGMGKGDLTNEGKSPLVDIPVSEGSVFLMPKDEPYKLRNVGKQDLEVLVIRMHATKLPVNKG